MKIQVLFVWSVALAAATCAFGHQTEISSIKLEAAGDHVDVVIRYMPINLLSESDYTASTVGQVQDFLQALAPNWLDIAIAPSDTFQPVTMPAGEMNFLSTLQQCEWKSTLPLRPTGQWKVRLAEVNRLEAGHVESATAVRRGRILAQALLSIDNQELAIDWNHPARVLSPMASVAPGEGAAPPKFQLYGAKTFILGIPTLLFVTLLLLGCGNLRSLLLTAGAFFVTYGAAFGIGLAHSLYIFPRLAAVLAVATLLFVAAENIWLFNRAPRSRPWEAGGFGLVQGFIVVAAYSAFLDDKGAPPSLLGLSLGVAGPVLLLCLLLIPMLRWLQTLVFYGTKIVPALSGLIATVGLVWYFRRIAG